MNRRRATLLSAVVGIGVGCAGNLGTAAAAAEAGAAADTATPRDVRTGAASPGAGADDRSGGRRGSPAATPRPQVPWHADRPGHRPGKHDRPWWPCFDPLILPSIPAAARDGGGGIVIAAAPAVLASTSAEITALSPAIGPSAERVLTGLAGALADAPAGPGAPPAAAGAAPPAPVSAPVGPPALAAPSPRSAAAPAAAPPAPPANRRPPAPPAASGTVPEPVRLGYPPYLNEADMARVVALALPGLAGLVGLTALGGLLGYRQARAGYAMRAAGTARFLQ